VTWWQTHSDARANASRISTGISREKKVADMLRAPAFVELMQ